jgi:nucleoside-diphosphate-sugar epimerase
MARYLVTGVAGFIASKVAEFLLDDGHAVVGIDNLNDAYDVRLKQWRLTQLQPHAGFHFHHLDITNRQHLRSLFDGHYSLPDPQYTAVLNLAARAGVRQSVQNPWVFFDTNVIGTLNLLELCREFDVEKFVLASSSSLYGARSPVPFREDADTDHPMSPYAASKKAAEALAHTYHYLHSLDVTVLRYFTVYGPAGRPDMSLFRFVHWISQDHPVLVYGDGTQSRDFTYVDDIARGTIAALEPNGVAGQPGYEVINLGSDEPIVLNDAIRLVEDLVGKRASLQHMPRHPADVLATWADISKARSILGWRPQVRFEDGIARLVDWYHRNQAWAKEIKAL